MTGVSIIIPAWNEAKTIKATLSTLLAIDYDKRRCEVLVVAGGDDNTYEIAQQLSVDMASFARYLVIPQETQRTKNAAIQLGLSEAVNDIIVLLDADTVVNRRWLRNLIEPIKADGCSLTVANSKPVRTNWVSDYYMIIKEFFKERISTHPGHSIAFKASVIENKIDYFFDKDVWMGDDYLFQSRVEKQGHKTMFVQEAVVKTHYPYSLKYFCEAEFRWLAAHIVMNGVQWKTLTYNVIVLGALIYLVPISMGLFVCAVSFHALYISKQARIFMVSSKRYDTRISRLFGFIMLSYICHIISICSHVWYFVGLRKDTYYQGQRC
jgi:cellulose synthase/poly-beta-1,6-N-acetylglucosamine synthase-like glycosyltransferase